MVAIVMLMFLAILTNYGTMFRFAVVQPTTPHGTTTEHFYDDLNRLTRITNKPADDTVLSDYQYTLGPAGNRTGVSEVIDEAGTERNVAWEYDALYRLTRETITYPADPSKDRTTSYTYDKVGNREQMIVQTDGCQTIVDYDYDDLDRLTQETRSIMLAAGGRFDEGVQYAVNFGDGTQLVATVSDHRPPPSPYAKPVLIVLASVTLLAVFAPLFLLWPRAPGLRSHRRRRRFFTATVALCMTPCMALSSKEVQALHHEAALYCAAQALPATCDPSVTTITYEYDNNGNMTRRERDDDADVYTYDVENQLVLITLDDDNNPTTPPVVQVEYAYDADGIRNSKTELPSGTVTQYLTDKNRPFAQVIQERDGADVELARYTYGDDLLSQVRGGVRNHYLYDGQLSVRQLTDAPADPVTTPPAVTDSYAYDAFGLLLESAGPTVNHYRYAGEQHDPNSGFYYLRARYYAQSLGRFINRDTYAGTTFDPDSLHKYLYVLANPVNNVDPSGHSPFSYLGKIAVLTIKAILIGFLLGAILGGIDAALRGDDILEGALLGGLIGGAFGALILIKFLAPVFLVLGIIASIAGILDAIEQDNIPLAVFRGATALVGTVFAFKAPKPPSGGRLGSFWTRLQNWRIARVLKNRGWKIEGGVVVSPRNIYQVREEDVKAVIM